MAHQNDHLIVKLSALVACILAIMLILILSGCGLQATHGPRNPFPKDAEAYNRRPRFAGGIIGINQARCFGGGIGGCGLGGKAQGGPTN